MVPGLVSISVVVFDERKGLHEERLDKVGRAIKWLRERDDLMDLAGSGDRLGNALEAEEEESFEGLREREVWMVMRKGNGRIGKGAFRWIYIVYSKVMFPEQPQPHRCLHRSLHGSLHYVLFQLGRSCTSVFPFKVWSLGSGDLFRRMRCGFAVSRRDFLPHPSCPTSRRRHLCRLIHLSTESNQEIILLFDLAAMTL